MNEYECSKCKKVVKAEKTPFICPKCGNMGFSVIDGKMTGWDLTHMVGRG